MNPIDFFIEAYRQTPTQDIVLEAIAFLFGIISVWLAKKEHIGVYPSGLVATVITVYLLYKAEYFGDMCMNIYYSAMSIYGWYLWALKKNHHPLLHITRTNFKEKVIGVGLFFLTMGVTYGVYQYFGTKMEWVNYVDVFTSGIFFTAMWYMAKKKLENWTLWIIGNIITVPLYAYRGLGMLSLQYFIFLILAIWGYLEWRKSLEQAQKD